jgi:hypothetical protein
MTDRRHVLPHPPDPSHLERYVLGLLDEPACEAIEEDAFGNPDVALAIDEAETRLIDAYAVGSLDATQRAQFERALAQRPRLQARVRFAGALTRRAAPAGRRRWWLSLAAAAAVLVTVALWNAGSLPSRNDARPVAEAPAQTQAAPAPGGHAPADAPPAAAPVRPTRETEPSRSDDTPGTPTRVVFAMTLPGSVSRSSATTTALAVPPASTHVELRVPIAPGDEYPRYRVRISDARAQAVATATSPRLSAARTVSILVDRRRLVDGTYEVTVEGLDVAGTSEPLAFLPVRVTTRH